MKLQSIFKVIAFIVFLWFVYYGRLMNGAQGLGVQSIGLVGLLFLLYLYNKRYQ